MHQDMANYMQSLPPGFRQSLQNLADEGMGIDDLSVPVLQSLAKQKFIDQTGIKIPTKRADLIVFLGGPVGPPKKVVKSAPKKAVATKR